MLGKRIREKREALGMSQEELARRLGYKSRSSINKIENDGRNLPQDKIYAIAIALDTTPGYIMGWEEEEDKMQTFLSRIKDLNLDENERTELLNFANYLISKRK